MIAFGVPTYNRPRYLEETLRACARHLRGTVDRFYVYDDGSASHHREAYWAAYDELPEATVTVDPRNRGVAAAKNALLREMLRDGADWLFLCEDDVAPLDVRAVTAYLDACLASGWQHLSFALHGPMNRGRAPIVEGSVALYPHYVGAYTVFSRESLEECGLFDEHFVNAWEHVELTMRLAASGYTEPRPWHVADAFGSESWVAELPGSEEHSTRTGRADFQENIVAGLAYWRERKPDSYRALFGADGALA